MSQLGLTMINSLAGNRESVAAVQAAQGKTITSVALVDNAIKFEFEDGSRLTLTPYRRTDNDSTADDDDACR